MYVCVYPQPPSPEHEETDSAPPPPVPMKKRQTIRKISEPTGDTEEPARPVPRPRINTLKKSESIPEVTPPPRPPKQSPSIPSLPPKPKPSKPENGQYLLASLHLTHAYMTVCISTHAPHPTQVSPSPRPSPLNQAVVVGGSSNHAWLVSELAFYWHRL